MGQEHVGPVVGAVIMALKRFFFKTPEMGAQTILHLLWDKSTYECNGLPWANNAIWKFQNPVIGDAASRRALADKMDEVYMRPAMEEVGESFEA